MPGQAPDLQQRRRNFANLSSLASSFANGPGPLGGKVDGSVNHISGPGQLEEQNTVLKQLFSGAVAAQLQQPVPMASSTSLKLLMNAL